MNREVFQQYDCPQGMDFDLEGERLVFKGATIQCSGCGRVHIAGQDVAVETIVDEDGERSYPDLPETAEELRKLVKG